MAGCFFRLGFLFSLGTATPSKVFAKAMESLSEWDLLPEGFSTEGLIFGGGSRAVYMELDSGLFLDTLYLQGYSKDMDGLWIVVDEETGLPIWIDCTFRSYGKVLPRPLKQENACLTASA